MTDEEKFQAAEAKLRNLEKRLSQGLEELHPAREKHLEKVREIVRQEWEKEHNKSLVQGEMPEQDKSKTQSEKSAQETREEPSQDKDSHSHDQDQGHDHGY